MSGIAVAAPVLTWAQRRSGRADDEIRKKFSDWDKWLSFEKKPSFAQVEKVADFTRVPLGYFFLPVPPIEKLPIPDFRVGRSAPIEASEDLFETIYLNQRRQAWYEDYLADFGEPERLTFVGSTADFSVEKAASTISNALEYGVEKRAQFRSIDDARLYLIEMFEDLGGLVVLNSMVANNTHRMLDIEEFRGFTLQSEFAPLVFVNANDTKNGQVFSLLHEFAHVWRGETGVSQGGAPLQDRDIELEKWCDGVAAEIAVPSTDLKREFSSEHELVDELERLAKRYFCSTLVVLLRLRDVGLVDKKVFSELYKQEQARILEILENKPAKGAGGDFYNNQPYRIGRTLSRAIVSDTKSGNTSMTEALCLLSFSRIQMFDKYADHIRGV
ncbi:ImmA/IrrE family metallo-endopeptidase [Propionimicrobium lymphophilum]|uniref:ImmA/IrrE family metallo-endopeptidase n=1 Tax=Propionimicrobium lymphophilum TaxID=33012 RepID=UPI003EC4D6C1